MVYYKQSCCVPGCSDKTSGRHRLPCFEKPRWKIWMKRIGNPRFVKDSDFTIYRNYLICNQHFTEDCFSPGTKRLNHNSLPSLNLPGFNEEPTLENSFAYPPGITRKSTTQDNTTQLPINFKTEVDPLSDGACIPGNDLEREPQTFVCPMCCEKQFSLVDLQQHISSYIWGKLKCPVCDEICVGLEILAVHLDEHHIYQEMLVPEISLWTNEDKGSYTAEESVNVSCGDVTCQVIKDQTDVLTDDDKESITVDKSMNCDEKNTNVERQDMEICSQLKNDNDGTLSYTGMITKNIYDDDKSVKKSEMSFYKSTPNTSLHTQKISIQDKTFLNTPEILSNTLKKSSNLGFDFENTPQQTTSQLQSTDSVSSDIETNDDYLSVIAGSSCAPDAHMSGVEQNSATSSENVSTSSTCEIENRDEALRGVNSNHKLCCRKCRVSFLNERAYVSHTKQFHSASDANQSKMTQHYKTRPFIVETKPSPFGHKLSVIRPLQCHICNKLFSYKDALRRHIQLHLRD